MTTTHSVPTFTVRFSTYRGLLLAVLCILIATGFLFDVQRGVSRPDAPVAAELRT